MAPLSDQKVGAPNVETEETSPPVDELTRSYYRTRSAKFEVLRDKTNNPVYAYAAILFTLLAGDPLPAWAIDGIVVMSLAIYQLALRCGATTALDDSERSYDPLTPQRAMELLASELQLARPGWNAFAAFVSDRDYMDDASDLQSARLLPDRIKEPAETRIARRRNIDIDEVSQISRSVNRRVQKGRTLLDRSGKTEPRG